MRAVSRTPDFARDAEPERLRRNLAKSPLSPVSAAIPLDSKLIRSPAACRSVAPVASVPTAASPVLVLAPLMFAPFFPVTATPSASAFMVVVVGVAIRLPPIIPRIGDIAAVPVHWGVGLRPQS